MTNSDSGIKQFDFAEHERKAIAEYLKVLPFYEDFSNTVARIIEECLKRRGIRVHSVQHRAKDPTSYGKKAGIPSDQNSNEPKYATPLTQITDLSGIRIISHFPSTLAEIDELLQEEFAVVEKSDKGIELIEVEKFGYQSVHYLVRLSTGRAPLAEYERFSGSVAEIQVRTILQHAWAEIEHDIQYKSSTSIPTPIRRRFMALAGLLELADREFQSIQDEDVRISAQAEEDVSRGQLTGVEITPRSLQQFLDKTLGSDGRMRDWSYDSTTGLLKNLGFRDLEQVEAAIAKYDDSQLSELAWGWRQGQIVRFELQLLAALGEEFIDRHPWRTTDWFAERSRTTLEKFRAAGIETGTYDPRKQGQ